MAEGLKMMLTEKQMDTELDRVQKEQLANKKFTIFSNKILPPDK